MLKSRSREIRIWWPLPLASALWVLIFWAFGFFLTAPQIEANRRILEFLDKYLKGDANKTVSRVEK